MAEWPSPLETGLERSSRWAWPESKHQLGSHALRVSASPRLVEPAFDVPLSVGLFPRKIQEHFRVVAFGRIVSLAEIILFVDVGILVLPQLNLAGGAPPCTVPVHIEFLVGTALDEALEGRADARGAIYLLEIVLVDADAVEDAAADRVIPSTAVHRFPLSVAILHPVEGIAQIDDKGSPDGSPQARWGKGRFRIDFPVRGVLPTVIPLEGGSVGQCPVEPRRQGMELEQLQLVVIQASSLVSVEHFMPPPSFPSSVWTRQRSQGRFPGRG